MACKTSPSSVISKLNEISGRNNIRMKFEKHPVVPTGTILHFGDKKYENISQNTKISRSVVASQALQDFQQGSVSQDSLLCEKIPSSISKVYQLSQKQKEKIEIKYESKRVGDTKIYDFHVSYMSFQGSGSSIKKQQAKEIAFSLIWDSISRETPQKSLNKISHREASNFSDSLPLDNIDYCPRDYQDEIFRRGVESNIIICLGTGTGKTFIAVLLMKKYSKSTCGKYPSAKRIVFLVPTVALVYQQADYIRRHTTFNVGNYCGENSDSSWSIKWQQEMEKNHVLVMTAEIFRQLLQHNAIGMCNISLIIFDECHHGINAGHPYNIIMTLYYQKHKISQEDSPRVIGLTASPAININFGNQDSHYHLKQRIDALEQIFNSKCITSIEYIESLKSIRSNPTINLVLYDEESDPSLLTRNLSQYLIKYQSKFELFSTKYIIKRPHISPITICINQNEENENQNTGGNTKIVMTAKKVQKLLVKAFNVANKVNQDIGLYGLTVYLQSLESGLLEIVGNRGYSVYIEVFNVFLKYIRKIHSFAISKVNDFLESTSCKRLENLWDSVLLSNKVSVLLKLLVEHYKVQDGKESEGESRISSIIFTKQIVTSSILSSVLNHLTKLEAVNMSIKLRFTCNFVIGISNTHSLKRLVSGVSQMNIRVVNARIQSFHHGSFDVLFSTNVLEEGIDVKSCCVVARFDQFSSLHSFIQSKGRIRNQDAHFYVFENVKNSIEINQQLSNFAQAENIVEDILTNYSFEELEDCGQFNLYPDLPENEQIIVTSTSKMDIRTAIAYLYRYCNSFSNNSNLCTKPIFLNEVNNCKIRFCLRFPSQINIYDCFYSEWLNDSIVAKKHCALNAIKYLHAHSMIDDNFLPLPPSYPREASIEEIVDLTNDMQIQNECPDNFYQKAIPSSLKHGDNSNTFYCYYIEFTQSKVCKSKEPYFGSLDFCLKDVGMLSPQKINEMSFPLASTTHSLQVHTYSVSLHPVSFSQEEVRIIQQFNKTIYEDLMNVVPKRTIWNPDNCHYTLYIILLKENYEIDFVLMNQFVEFHKFTINHDRNMLATRNLNEALCHGTVVYKNYSKDRTTYCVAATDEVDSSSLIPGQKISYQKYYSQKWKINVVENELMLTCFSISKSVNMVKKVRNSRTRQTGVIHIPNSCVNVDPILYSTHHKLLIMPSFIKRLTDFLNIYEWCENRFDIYGIDSIDSETLDSFVHSDILNIDRCAEENIFPVKNMFDHFYILLNDYWNNEKSNGISFKSLFQAFTRVSSNECCDYERMELLGDTFIRVVSTMFLFATFPSHSEGALTKHRNTLVSNKIFCEIGKSIGLQNVINSKPVKFGENWCPPGYVLIEEEFKENHNGVILHQHITEKAIADVIESLVGCCLISSNVRNTYDFMCKLKLISTFGDYFDSFDKLISGISQLPFYYPNLDEISQDIDSVELILDYRFRDRNIIAQALSHVSCLVDTKQDSYERLELLGDSLIGFLIDLYLYLSHEEWKYNTLSPFVISHLHHALVNNNLLGLIAAKYGLVKSVQLKNYSLHLALSQFLRVVESLGESENIVEVPFIGMICESQSNDANYSTYSYTLEAINIPKLAADVFESIMGAVFIDCGCDLIVFASKFLPFFKYYIELYLKTFPIHPRVFVAENITNLEKSTTKISSSRFQTILKYPGNNIEYIGTAQTMDDAYDAACYCLLKYQDQNNNLNVN